MDSEAHLLERLKAGDETAFADFMEFYQQRIYYLALRWVSDQECTRGRLNHSAHQKNRPPRDGCLLPQPGAIVAKAC